MPQLPRLLIADVKRGYGDSREEARAREKSHLSSASKEPKSPAPERDVGAQ